MVSFNNQRFQEKPEHTRKPGRKAGLQAVPDGKEEPDDRPEDVDHSYTGVHPLLAPLHHLRYMVSKTGLCGHHFVFHHINNAIAISSVCEYRKK